MTEKQKQAILLINELKYDRYVRKRVISLKINLNNMNYEKKLALAKEALDSGSYDKETIEYIFPELAESEDERIRKDIIVLVKDWWDRVNKDNISTKEQMLAWIEKQGEPKWTEEDECYMSECIGAIATKDSWTFEEKRKTKHWLESLKQRMEEQQWTE